MASSWLETRPEQQAGLTRLKGSEQERHSIGSLWLLWQSGLEGARTGLETVRRLLGRFGPEVGGCSDGEEQWT